MSEPQEQRHPAQDDASYRRGEQRVLFRVLLLGIPLFIVAFLCLPNIGPVLRVFSIPSTAMAPTLPMGSYIIVSRASYGYSRYSFDTFELPIGGRWPALVPRRGDVVVFRLPRDRKIHFIKRVVGLPGDRIQMIKGRLSINGQLVQIAAAQKIPHPSGGKGEVPTYVETLADGSAYRIVKLESDSGPYDNTPELLVPPGRLFVLGDNRNNSVDSRAQSPTSGVGFVPIELVVGRIVFTF